MASTNEKLAFVVLLGFVFRGVSSSSKATPAKIEKTPPQSGKKAPQEVRPEPGPLVDLRPDEKDKAPQDKAPQEEPPRKDKAPQETPARPTAAPTPDEAAPAEQLPKKPAKKPAKKETEAKKEARELDAVDLAARFFGEYKRRGIEDEQAATEALTLYMLAGGNDPKIIKGWQKAMVVTASGEYDKETSQTVSERVDMAIDGAINTTLQKTFAGEQPATVAGQVLLQYVTEAREINALLPREKIAALQLAMQMDPVTGILDKATEERLVELGINPSGDE